MTRYEWIFCLAFGSVMLFLVNANFQHIIWEFLYFYSRIIILLIMSLVMISRAKNLYEKKLANLLKCLFLTILGWEVTATISWELANTKIVYVTLLIIVIGLIANLFYWRHKYDINEYQQRYKK